MYGKNQKTKGKMKKIRGKVFASLRLIAIPILYGLCHHLLHTTSKFLLIKEGFCLSVIASNR